MLDNWLLPISLGRARVDGDHRRRGRHLHRPWTFIAAVVLVLLPLAAGAQPQHAFRVAYVAPAAGPTPESKATLRRLAEFGYVEGRNLVFDAHWMAGHEGEYTAVVASLVDKADVALVVTDRAALPARRLLADKVPVVFTYVSDPVGLGLVATLARPGGNMTGMADNRGEVAAKRLELLRRRVMRFKLAGLVATLALGLLAGPPSAEAQQAAKVATVGVSNQNVRIETRYSAGRPEALGPLAAELVGLGVDVLVAWGGPASVAAKRATSRIPVVFLAAGDPIRFGLVSSLARPGGNVTGVSFDASPEIDVKRLELLKEVVPALARVALLVPSDTPRRLETRTIIAAARQALNVEVREIAVRTPSELETAIRSAKERGAQALSVWTMSPSLWERQHSELAIAQRLPSIHWFGESARAGGLLSYAASLTDIAGRGAVYVDRILRGAKPADLPVEQPTKFDLVINLKTAKALGLTVPRSLLSIADQVIQ